MSAAERRPEYDLSDVFVIYITVIYRWLAFCHWASCTDIIARSTTSGLNDSVRTDTCTVSEPRHRAMTRVIVSLQLQF